MFFHPLLPYGLIHKVKSFCDLILTQDKEITYLQNVKGKETTYSRRRQLNCTF